MTRRAGLSALSGIVVVAPDTPSLALMATEHGLRCMVESHCNPSAVGLYAVTRLDAHTREILTIRRQLFDAIIGAPAWSPLGDAGFRAEIDDYFRTASHSVGQGYTNAALAQYQRRTEAFVQRMELVLQQSGSSKTGRILRHAVGASATETAMSALATQFQNAGAPAAVLPPWRSGQRRASDIAEVGNAIYSVYGVRLSTRERLQQWRRPKTLANVHTSTLPPALGELGRWATDLDHQLAYAERLAPDFAAFVELETALPSGVAIHDRHTIQARVHAFRDFEAQLPSVERSERTYLIEATTSQPIHTVSVRPPLVDVAQLVTYQRIRNHADPLAVVNMNLAVVGVGGAAQVVRAAEIALTRRHDELHTDRLQGVDGDVFHRPAGFDVHPRYRTLAQRAVEAQTAPEFLDEIFHAFPDGERDPEYLRIDRYVSRLVEAACIRTAIGIIRPLTRGELIAPPTWPNRIATLTDLMFEELEGPQPLVNARGDVMGWQDLVSRHPEAKTARTTFGGVGNVSSIEPAWIKPPVDEVEAYGAPAP